MAKLKGPLFSLGASGQLAKTLVFFPWKGLNVAREYVIPSNPQTALQVTHRGYMTAAVAAIHAAQADATHPMLSIDQVAYSALAAAKGIIMTWFNQISKLWIDVAVAAKSSVIYHGGVFGAKTAAAFEFHLYLTEETGSDLAAGKFYFGTSKTNLINSEACDINPGSYVYINVVDLQAFLTAGVKYYVQFRPDVGDPSEGADSGIYNFVAE